MNRRLRSRRSVDLRWSDDQGDVSSWLIVAAGLAAAAVLASSAMGRITDQLTDRVAAAAEVGPAGVVAAGSGEASPGPSPFGAGDGTATRITTDDGRAAIMRQSVDGRLGVISLDDEGHLDLLHVDETGTVVRAQAEVTGDDESGWRLGTWHFEGRAALNSTLPGHVDEIVEGDGWTELTAGQSVFHDDPATADPERKFVHIDGREAVYNPETGELVTDPRYAGTYNYVNPAPVPEEVLDVGGWLSWTFRGLGHGITDVLPYLITGNVRGADPAPD